MKFMTLLPYGLTLAVAVAAAAAFYVVTQNGASKNPSGIQFGGSVALPDDERKSDGHDVEDPVAADDDKPVGEFTLTERSGEPFESKEMKGKVWVASYFFSACPGACIQLNRNLSILAQDKNLKDVTFVSITCDPENDTLDVLKEYADRFQADPQRWLFCRGDLEYVRKVGADSMKVAVENQMHSDRAIVIDGEGKVRGRFRVTDPNQFNMLKALLHKLAKEPA